MAKSSAAEPFEIFLVCAPGLEPVLAEEAAAAGFAEPRAVPGGVKFKGYWPEVWRANLVLRGAGRVLARLDSFQVFDLDKLARRARRVPWTDVLPDHCAVAIDVTCRQSRLFHSGAVAERIGDAMAHKVGARISKDAALTIMVRLDNDICTISVDTSGEPLHKRGHKTAVHRAPLRETMAALFLRQCGFTGQEPVLDPMCGSGTIVIEAAERALGLLAGCKRSFAFEALTSFDETQWQSLRRDLIAASERANSIAPSPRFFGHDRDQAAIEISLANARAAGIDAVTAFSAATATDLARPDGPPGLILVNPPYGERIGDRDRLVALYRALGRVLVERFAGWRVGLITSDKQLAYATMLPFLPPGPPVSHGGVRVTLFQTGALVGNS